MQVGALGIDLAKNVFQVHGIDAAGKVVITRKLRRSQVLTFFAKLPPCLVRHGSVRPHRTIGHATPRALGHDVRKMPASYVKAYVKRNKNDAADAAAICEAVTRPSMRFVPVDTAEQQAALMLRAWTRDLLVRQRTAASINALRAHLAELGLVAAQGCDGLKVLVGIIRNGTRLAQRGPDGIADHPQPARRTAAANWRARAANPRPASSKQREPAAGECTIRT